MSGVHFDVDAARRDFIKGCEDRKAEVLSLAETAEDRELVRVQCAFDEVSIESVLVVMRLENEGASREILATAAGVYVGNLMASFFSSLASSQRIRFLEAMNDAFNGCQGHEVDGMVSSMTRAEAVKAGHA